MSGIDWQHVADLRSETITDLSAKLHEAQATIESQADYARALLARACKAEVRADSLRAAVAELTAERDAARAEVHATRKRADALADALLKRWDR